MDLSNKAALVTGSGRGIGRAIALRLAEAGADLVINDVDNPEPANSVVEEIKRMGRSSTVIMADISQSEAVNRLVEELVEVLSAGKGMVVEVGAERNHDRADILDRLLVLGRDGGHRGKDHKGDERLLHSSSRLTKGS